MGILHNAIYVVMFLSAGGIVLLVLMQHGKGADMGTGFGAGASGSLFGATGSANFLSRSTAILAAIFFSCTLALSYLASNRPKAAPSSSENLPAQSLPASKTDVIPGPVPAPAANPAPAPAQKPVSKGDEIPK